MYTIVINNLKKINCRTFQEVIEFLKTHDHCNNNTMIFKNDYLFADYCYPALCYRLNSLSFVDQEFPKYSDQIEKLRQGFQNVSLDNVSEFVDKNYNYYCLDNFPNTFKSEDILKILTLSFFVENGFNLQPLIFIYNSNF